MANFQSTNNAVVVAILEFVSVSTNTMQQFKCKDGEIAGFVLIKLPVLGSDFTVSQIYDCSSGTPILQGTVSSVPGMDLTGGLFSSGCFPSGDPFDNNTKFYKVDY